MNLFELRQAVASMERIVRDAHGPYVERMPVAPAPMTSDYRRLVGSGSAWVLVRDETVIGLMILVVRSRHVDVQNVAVARACSVAMALSYEPNPRSPALRFRDLLEFHWPLTSPEWFQLLPMRSLLVAGPTMTMRDAPPRSE